MIVIGEHVCKWVAERLGGKYVRGSAAGIGWYDLKSQEIIAGAYYDSYNGSSCHIAVAAIPGKRWLKREFLWYMFYYPFMELKVNKLLSVVDSTNLDSIKFTENLGAIRQTTITKAGKNGCDMLVYAIDKDDCRFLNIRRP